MVFTIIDFFNHIYVGMYVYSHEWEENSKIKRIRMVHNAHFTAVLSKQLKKVYSQVFWK